MSFLFYGVQGSAGREHRQTCLHFVEAQPTFAEIFGKGKQIPPTPHHFSHLFINTRSNSKK
jgi:hypothetical protein